MLTARNHFVELTQRDRLVSVWCCATSVGYMSVFDILRYAASPALFLATLLALAGVSIGWRVARIGRLHLFISVSILYLSLSFFHVFPKTWTIYWDSGAALRQWSWAILLPIFTGSFSIVFRYAKHHFIRHSIKYVLFLFVITRCSLLFAPLEIDIDTQTRYTIYTFVSENALFTFFLALHVIYRVKPSLFSVIALLPLTLLFSSAQSSIGYASLLAIWFVGCGPLVIAGLSAALTALLVIAPYYVKSLYMLDHNTGFRALLWSDASKAFLESRGIGVGYGTEYVSNDFGAFDIGAWKITQEDASNRLLIGTHSTFYDILMRTGIIGITSFGYWFVSIMRTSLDSKTSDGRMNAFACVLLLLINSVNMGVTSVNFMLGTCLCAGWLLSNTSLKNPRQRHVSSEPNASLKERAYAQKFA